MYTFLFALLLFAPVAAILSTLVYAVCMVRRGMSARRAVLRQFCAFLVVGVLCCRYFCRRSGYGGGIGCCGRCVG